MKLAKTKIEKESKSQAKEKNNDKADSEDVKEEVKVGDIIGILNIPRLDREIPIIEGTDSDSLDKGVGHLSSSYMPRENNMIFLAGHRNTVFTNFNKIQKGDSFYLDDFTIVGDMVHLEFISSKKYSNSEFFLENGEKLTLNSNKVILTIVAKSLEKGENSMVLYETDKEYLPLFINDDIIFENTFFILGMYISNI